MVPHRNLYRLEVMVEAATRPRIRSHSVRCSLIGLVRVGGVGFRQTSVAWASRSPISKRDGVELNAGASHAASPFH